MADKISAVGRQNIFRRVKHGHEKCSDTHFLTAIFRGEHGLAGCPLNSSPLIPELCILLGHIQTFHVILNTIPPGLYWESSLS